MPPLTGPFLAAVLVVGVAGAAKVATPDATRVALRSAGLPGTRAAARLLGTGEVALALLALAVGGAVPAAAVAVLHLGFAWFSWRLLTRSRGRASCGCFGAADAPVTRLHVMVNLVVAAGCGVVAVASPPAAWASVRAVADDAGALAAAAFVVGVAGLARLLVALLADLPALQAATRRPAGRVATRGVAS